MTEPTDGPIRPSVALAIVTSHRGVLVVRRRDGNPPWVFPGGKIEPGELPEDAAVRETLEETKLRVRAIGVLGSRVHPETSVSIVYMAVVPTADAQGTHVCASFETRDDRELMEVRWISPVEADRLMPGMYEPVRQSLTTGEPDSGRVR